MTSGRVCALILAILMLIGAFWALGAANSITPKNVDWENAEDTLPGGTVLAFLVVSWTVMIATMIGLLLWVFALFFLIILACKTHGAWRIAMWCAVVAAALIGIILLSL